MSDEYIKTVWEIFHQKFKLKRIVEARAEIYSFVGNI